MQIACYLKGGSSRVYDDGVSVLDHICRSTSDCLLLTIVCKLLETDVHFFLMLRRTAGYRTSTGPHKEVSLLEQIEVLSDGDFRNTEHLTEVGNRHA